LKSYSYNLINWQQNVLVTVAQIMWDGAVDLLAPVVWADGSKGSHGDTIIRILFCFVFCLSFAFMMYQRNRAHSKVCEAWSVHLFNSIARGTGYFLLE